VLTCSCYCNSKAAGDFVGSICDFKLLYVLAMLLLLNRSKRIGDLYAEKDNIGKPVMAIFFFC
jgi:hypothetical protein